MPATKTPPPILAAIGSRRETSDSRTHEAWDAPWNSVVDPGSFTGSPTGDTVAGSTRRTRTPCPLGPKLHHATNTLPLASVTMSGRTFVPPEDIATRPPGESPRWTTMSAMLYHVWIGVPSTAVVTPAVRPRANSAFSTKIGAVHGPPARGAVAVTRPSIGMTPAKNTRRPLGSASSAGSAPRLQPETIVVVAPACPAGVIGRRRTSARASLQATLRTPSDVRATPSSCETEGAVGPSTTLVQRPGTPADTAPTSESATEIVPHSTYRRRSIIFRPPVPGPRRPASRCRSRTPASPDRTTAIARSILTARICDGA